MKYMSLLKLLFSVEIEENWEEERKGVVVVLDNFFVSNKVCIP